MRKRIELDLELITQLREKENKTYQQIADIIGCSSTTIRNFCIKNKIDKKSIIGQSFEKSKLKVIERDNSPSFSSHETAYKCQCLICGEIKTYRKSNIENGPGCHKCSGVKGGRGYKEWEIGQKFGFIEIIGKSEKTGFVVGKCECGTVRDFNLKHLKGQGHSRTTSCGCKQQSSGEIKIEQILKDYNIKYQKQFKILDFSSFAAFDFAIFNESNKLIKLIEYDGEQHYFPVEHFGGEENFLI